MSGETKITIVGNLTADPEMRFTSKGTACANLTIASTPRTYDRQAGQWVDGTTLFLRCAAFRDIAENIAETLRKGMSVIATGTLTQHDYEDRNGSKRTSVELTIDDIGPSLRHARATVTRNSPREGTVPAASRANSPTPDDYTRTPYGNAQGGWYGNSSDAPF